MPRKTWFTMKASDDLAEIEIFDEIDSFWGIGAKEFKARFDEVKNSKAIKLMLNSPGGSVFDGMAIYNILSSVREKLDIEVVGLAASISSIIALAGKKLTMAEGSYYMIHNPLTIMVGDAEELRKTADVLDKMKGDFVSIYGKKSGLDSDEIASMMDDETWLTASEAIEKGFADESVDYGQIAAKADPEVISRYGFSHAPKGLSGETKSKVNDPRSLESLLRDAGGLSKNEAVAIVANGWKAVGRGEPEPQRGEPVKSNITPAMLIKEMDAVVKR